jgi:hypothetical protein
MTRDDIIRMAREAGLLEGGTPAWVLVRIEAFAALVTAAERKACAQVCDEWVTANYVYVNGAIRCGLAIRARGQA